MVKQICDSCGAEVQGFILDTGNVEGKADIVFKESTENTGSVGDIYFKVVYTKQFKGKDMCYGCLLHAIINSMSENTKQSST